MSDLPPKNHNNPPLSPYELSLKEIEDLYGEAVHWLDGSKVDSAPLAEGVGKLLVSLRDAAKKADEARIAEKKPYDDAITEIQSRYLPLIGDTKTVKGKTVLAIDACKKALAPWLQKIDDEKKAIAEKARLEAEEKARLAREAFERLREQEERADAPPPEDDEGLPDSPPSAGPTLEERAAAEALFQDAKDAQIQASVAAKDTARVSGGGKRSISLRTSYKAEITDYTAFVRHLWVAHKISMKEYLDTKAKELVDSGGRGIPGVNVIEVKTAV